MSFDFGPYPDTLEAVLRRRGHRVTATGDVRRILFPEERIGEVLEQYRTIHGDVRFQELIRPGIRERYHALYGQASFRKLARRLVLAGGKLVRVKSLRENAGDRVDEYLEFLEALDVVDFTAAGVRCTRALDNLGPSLEHYVARLCVLDLLGTSEWGVHLEGLPHAGGDYDVLAWLSPALVYVECKSARPDAIGEEELRHFLQRHVELAPDLAILFVDTGDDLGALVDRLNSIVRPVMENHPPPAIVMVGGDAAPGEIVQQGDYGGVWFGADLVVSVTNAHPSIMTQLRRCLQHYHALVRGRAIVPAALPRFVDG